MTDELIPDKIIGLLEHWIEHNNSHVKSFNTWAEKIKQAGFVLAAENVIHAVERMNEATEYLKQAQQEVRSGE